MRAGRSCTLPTVLGAVVVTYNLPGIHSGLKITGSLLADIFLGKVTRWNDPALVKLNAHCDQITLISTSWWHTDRTAAEPRTS